MNIVLTGGGSAGHIIPNLALVDELKKYFDNIYYIGSDKPNEKKLVEDYKIPYYSISTPKLIRKLTFKNFTIPFKLIKSICQCKKILKNLNVDVVFSKGGYVSLPVVIAAHQLKIKVIIHESDTSMGLSNKISSKFSDKICTSFPLHSNNKKIIYTGAPIRKEFFIAKQKKFFDNNKKIILVIGGSQGSNTLNNFIYQNIDYLTKKYNIIHICGYKKLKKINNNSYIQFEFSNDMPTLIKSSDIILTRGGSNALFEILAINKPMIIVPLTKKESRGEQIDNAKYFMQNNLACYLEKLELDEFENCIQNQLKNSQNIFNLQNTFISINGPKYIVNCILNTISKN